MRTLLTFLLWLVAASHLIHLSDVCVYVVMRAGGDGSGVRTRWRGGAWPKRCGGATWTCSGCESTSRSRQTG